MEGDLRSFIDTIDRCGALRTVSCPVSPHLEIAAIIDRVCKGPDGGPALLFTNVAGSSMPLAANLFGSSERMALALGGAIDGLAEKLRADLRRTGERDSVRALQQLITSSACHEEPLGLLAQDCFDATDDGLAALPALHAWPNDGGRYLTLCQVYTRDPVSQQQNCGLYRVQIVDRHTALLRCHPGSGGARHLAAWQQSGQPMPVALVLGGPPAMTWAACTSLPDGVDENDFVAYLGGKPVSKRRCLDVPLTVPAGAEIVLEGWVHPGEEALEGPFGNHTGRYVPAAPAPLLRISRMTVRQGAIYPCTVVGPPPMENIALARTTERLLLPLLQHDHPWVVDVHMPAETIFHRLAMVALRRDCDEGLDHIVAALLSSAVLKGAKALVLFDEDTPLRDRSRIFWQAFNASSCAATAAGSCARVIDARLGAPAERVQTTGTIDQRITARWQEYGVPDGLDERQT